LTSVGPIPVGFDGDSERGKQLAPSKIVAGDVEIESFGVRNAQIARGIVLGRVPTNMNDPQAAIDQGIPAGFPNSVFDLTPTFQLQPGSLGRNALNGPKFVNFDFAVLKDTHLGKTERMNLQFRVEFFNLFNNVNFHQPYSRTSLFYAAQPSFASEFPGLCRLANNAVVATCFLPDPFFGQILEAFPARQVQFALKLLF
jgi:hypothetical protein